MNYHPLLIDQLERNVGDRAAAPEWQAFLKEIDVYYRRTDIEHQAIEQTLLNLSQELNDSNTQLRAELEERQLAQQALIKKREEQETLIKKLEEAHNQLLQSEKLASIGQLAAGVAHEINNPIGFVNSNLGTLRDYVSSLLKVVDGFEAEEAQLRPDTRQRLKALREAVDLAYLREDAVTLLEESTEGVRRVRQIVQDLKDFSHVDEAQWMWADLRKGIDSTLNIVNNEIKYIADVVKQYEEMPDIECLPSQLNQVFLNMFVNASHAVAKRPSGGRGVITVRTGRGDEHTVFVEIADNGCGMTPEVMNRIFDPFYTTKPVGQGTGLGLSLAYGIVNKHGGRIDVSSTPGEGTTFRINLPVEQVTAEAGSAA